MGHGFRDALAPVRAVPCLLVAAFTVLATFVLLAAPPEAEAKLCRGESEAACKGRPECQWLERERRAPEAQARAEASPEFHCVPRPATGDSISERRERARRRARDAHGEPKRSEQLERDMKRFERRERVERDGPRPYRKERVERDEPRPDRKERVERDEPRPDRKERVERDIDRPGRVERDTKPREERERGAQQQRNEKKRGDARARERERSSQAREALRKKREAARQKARRNQDATKRERPRREREREDD